jgi:hypothetical protein
MWQGDEGRCGGCQTTRRPTAQYVNLYGKPRWLCDRCLVKWFLAGWPYLPWEERDRSQDDQMAAYESPPKEPALRPRPVVGQDQIEAAVAEFGTVGWEEQDDEIDCRLRLNELRRLGIAVADLFQAATTSNEERLGLLRIIELVQVRMRELGG